MKNILVLWVFTFGITIAQTACADVWRSERLGISIEYEKKIWLIEERSPAPVMAVFWLGRIEDGTYEASCDIAYDNSYAGLTIEKDEIHEKLEKNYQGRSLILMMRAMGRNLKVDDIDEIYLGNQPAIGAEISFDSTEKSDSPRRKQIQYSTWHRSMLFIFTCTYTDDLGFFDEYSLRQKIYNLMDSTRFYR